MRTPKDWLDSMFSREVTPEYIAAIQADARQGMVPVEDYNKLEKLLLEATQSDTRRDVVPAAHLKEAQTDRDDARKEAAKTLVQLGKVEDQRDEALGILRVLQPQVKMWLAGSSEYEWIGKLLEGRFGEGIYKPK